MRKEKNLVRYLFQWLLVIFVIFALVSIGFNVLTYLREREYYVRIIEEEQQNRINTLSRNMNEELTKLKITAEMTVRSDPVLELCNLYDFVNSFEKDKMIEEIRENLVELDNQNAYVEKSALYLPERKIKIDREGFSDGEEYDFFLSLSKEKELIVMDSGRAFLIGKFPGSDNSGKIMSLFVIELNTEQILEELRFSRMTEKDLFLMTSPEGKEVYFQTEGMKQENPVELTAGKKVTMEGEKYQVKEAENSGSFFHLYYLQDQEFLYMIQEKMVTNILLFAGIILMTILTAAVIFYRRLFWPLEILLVEAFGQIKKSNFSYRIPLPGKGSVFRNLYENFNYMAERIDTLISRELKQQILVNQANFKHLQAQINPHFMYNSYFLLYRLIKKGDREGSLMVCENLGQFFQYINRDSEENKSLTEEIEHARSYAVIQGIRYQNAIQIDFESLPEKYGYIEVPRLIVQPLIENVFKYAASQLDEDEKIKLKVGYEEREDHLLVCVENSGNLSEETLEEIRRKLNCQKEGEEVTALMNIKARLDVFFHQENSLTVCRSELGGLKVCLYLKL